MTAKHLQQQFKYKSITKSPNYIIGDLPSILQDVSIIPSLSNLPPDKARVWHCLNGFENSVPLNLLDSRCFSSFSGAKWSFGGQTAHIYIYMCVCVCVCVFPEIGVYPQIVNFNWIFPYKPTIIGTSVFGKPPRFSDTNYEKPNII